MSGVYGMKWGNVLVPNTHHKKYIPDVMQCPEHKKCRYNDCGHKEEHNKIPNCVRDHRDDCPSCRKIKSENEKMSNADHKLFAEISQEL